jgi:DNA-binding NtrC family response regulator
VHNQRIDPQPKPGVLIVSHEPSIRSLLAEVLSLDNYPTQTAADAEEGLALLCEATDGRIVLLQLDPYPDMWELMRMLHEHPSLRTRHRIVQVDIDYYVEKARSLAPGDVLVMPFTTAQLFDMRERNAEVLTRSQEP